MQTKIMKCEWPARCKNEYQDKKYGHGMRVFNLVDDTHPKARCTVCGSEQDWGHGN